MERKRLNRKFWTRDRVKWYAALTGTMLVILGIYHPDSISQIMSVVIKIIELLITA